MKDLFKLEHGDCIKILKSYPDNYFHSIVTDPPYNISIDGAKWDSFKSNRHFQKWCNQWSEECFRVLKPGGYIISFSSNRTYHRMACALEDTGFIIKDTINWLFESGMPKGKRSEDKSMGSMLKPSSEPAVLAQKPIEEKNVKEQYKKTQTGWLHINSCRLPKGSYHWWGKRNDLEFTDVWHRKVNSNFGSKGKWCNAEEDNYEWKDLSDYVPTDGRFPANTFLCKKANKKEKEAGIRSTGKGKRRNIHPSVKPLKLMKWCVRLVTPPNGIVLDPFIGSGTTALACVLQDYRCVGIEKNENYLNIINNRVNFALKYKNQESKK